MSERVATNTILYAIPRLARDVVVRPAMLSLLEKANDARLLAFVAPSGFGKTTFLTQHARGLRTPVLWLELQDFTNASGLANGLLEVFALAFPELKLESNTPGTARAVALTLAQTPAATIILDQADHLNLEGTRWLEQFVSELPEGTRLLIAGRELEHLRLPSLIADGRVMFNKEIIIH